MKHPFQLIAANKDGTHLFASVKNHVLVFDLKNGEKVGFWTDEIEVGETGSDLNQLPEQKVKTLEKEVTVEEPGEKKAKTNSNGVVTKKKTSIPISGGTLVLNYIRTLRLSRDENLLICITDSDKSVVVFAIDYANTENCLRLLKRQGFAKRPCAVSTSLDDKYLAVADKFGDVYNIAIEEEPGASDKSLSPILGHVSMLTDIAIADNLGKQFILSGDRDEHIRVSNYPQSYIIRNWLFGHREFVSSLVICGFDKSLLLSGGGDEFICLWNWFDNQLLSKLELREYIEPFLTNEHLPPERFLTDKSPREISITKILTFSPPSNNANLVFILCENTRCILSFQIMKDHSFNHIETKEFATNLVDFTLIEKDGLLVASLDTDCEDRLLGIYQIDPNDNKLATTDLDQLSGVISQGNTCEISGRDQVYPLYNVHNLRKRSEH